MSRQTKEAIRKYTLEHKDQRKIYDQFRKESGAYSAYKKRRHRADPRRTMLYMAVNRSRKRNLPFDLTLEDIVIPEICPIRQRPFTIGEGKPCPDSPSLDRINNAGGYTKDNVRVISYRANTWKGNMTSEEIERLYNYSIGKI